MEALGSSDHGPRLEDAHAKAKGSREAWTTRRGSAELGLLAEFVTCRVDGVKGGAVSAQPAALQLRQSRRARSGRGTFARRPPGGEKPHRQRRERRHRLRTLDAARDAIDAAQRRMIDPRGSDVTAEANEECLLRRAIATSRKCVLARAVSTTRVSPPPPVLTFDTANLEARATPSPGVAVETI